MKSSEIRNFECFNFKESDNMEDGPKVHTTSKTGKSSKRSSSKNREQRRRGSSKRRHDDGIEQDSSNENINEIGRDKEPTGVETNQQQTTSSVTINIENESKSQLKVSNGTAETLPRSPAQRSTRSRASSDKSPKHKRSKSESRRRRERKLQAAGELEVRQANETLMRYLKQCSDLNDASGSLSGDLEISENLDDRKVHRKTKSQREKKSFRLIGECITNFVDFSLILTFQRTEILFCVGGKSFHKIQNEKNQFSVSCTVN